MAEFRIQRFKYTWKGAWQSAITYNPDDVIRLSGKVYACLERHTSAVNFYTDLLYVNQDVPPVAEPKWVQIADGVSFRGSWQPSTAYSIGDIVRLGGQIYICLIGHTSTGGIQGFNSDYLTNGRWALFFEGFDWVGNWNISTDYRIGDLVKYSGKLFVCIVQHQSSGSQSAGLIADSNKWSEFVSNVSWKGAWTTSFDYRLSDIVKYGGKLYICVQQHTSTAVENNGLESDQAAWQEFFDGIEFIGNWADNSKYKINDLVKYGSYIYKSNQNHLVGPGQGFDATLWDIYCPGQEFDNQWSSASVYQAGDVIKHGGFLYVSKTTNTNSQPDWDQSNTNSDWELLFQGTRIQGDWSSTITYRAGDVVRKNGQLYISKRNVGMGQDVDIINDGSTINSDDWELVVPGSFWRGIWVEDRNYVIGDLVQWQGSTYRCIERNFSELSNRPDNSFGLGIEWEEYAVGNDNNVLSFVGDIKTFGILQDQSTLGPKSISIGNQGQALKVDSNDPVWNNFNQAEKVYYVSLDGVDQPTSGTTLNSPWRTLRYALDNITGAATVFVKTGVYDEILPMRIPANVAIVGDELRGTVIRPAQNYFSSDDINKFEDAIDFISSIASNIVKGIAVSALGTVDQVLTAPFATNAEVPIVLAKLAIVKDAITNANPPPFQSTNTISVDADLLAAAQQLENNIDFISNEVEEYVRSNYPSYVFRETIFDSAISRILKAVAYDLRYTGNYKSVEAGKFFYAASNYNKNKTENMFLMRDGTGLRNCTLVGLEGALGNVNAFLTRRPSAGAYASLDPGWGPADTTSWVGNRSPYVQNVTTFGEACVGLKIDGQLHNGGNKTIVANDFTQILSDGIGVWANADGGTEVVSVFTYYNHIGYLCTNGGKIRGTNGNCSYGQYGAVAEGVNQSESPILGEVDNRFFDASVGQIFTNGSNILKLFYSNAGQNYTSASYSVAGAGINASLLADEFRDGAVYQVRIANQADSSNPFGNAYTLNINNAQTGDAYSITLSASADFTAAYLRGLRLVVNSGTGAGQYGYVADYDNATKILLIGRENYEALTATSTESATDTLTISSAVNHLRTGDRVCFTGTSLLGGLTANTVYTVDTVAGSAISLLDQSSTPVALTNSTGTMQVLRLGWDHFQAGFALAPALDTTSRYFIEPRPVFTDSPKTSTARQFVDNTSWSSISFGNGVWIAITEGNNTTANNGSIVNRSTDGIIWTQENIPIGGWVDITYGNGKFVVVAKDSKTAYSSDGITWNLGTIPAAEYRSVAYGNGFYVAVASGGNSAARSADGITWSAVNLPEGADWSGIAFGKGRFVAVSQGDSSSADVAYSTNNGLTWTSVSVTGGAKSITYGNNRFVILAGGYAGADKSFVSFDGATWLSGRIDAYNWSSVSYGEGVFVAVARFENFVGHSPDGREWRYFTIDDGLDWSSIAFAKDSTGGKFIAVAKDSDSIREIKIGARTQARAFVDSNRLSSILIFEPGSRYVTAPTLNIIDPNNTVDASITTRMADGVIASPSIVNSGEGWQTTSTTAAITGDGFADNYQTGSTLILKNLTRIPDPGDNLVIDSITDFVYKVQSSEELSGGPGTYQARLVIAKALSTNESPEHLTSVTIRQQYSQVRLTGHDFLEIGLGNFEQTNYPDTLFPNGTVVSPENETVQADGGRVFYTSTDQDGNFRVGELFAVEQSTGTVTISADFFELQGLEELSLGGVSVGGSGVVIREFSTDPLFVADSNTVVPTQRAIKEYIARRVSGGGSDAFTGQFTAGVVRVGPSVITTTTQEKISIPVKVNMKRPVAGKMLAMSYFVNSNTEDIGDRNEGQ